VVVHSVCITWAILEYSFMVLSGNSSDIMVLIRWNRVIRLLQSFRMPILGKYWTLKRYYLTSFLDLQEPHGKILGPPYNRIIVRLSHEKYKCGRNRIRLHFWGSRLNCTMRHAKGEFSLFSTKWESIPISVGIGPLSDLLFF
jgi:hypothetical protein